MKSVGPNRWIRTSKAFCVRILSRLLGTERITTYPWYADTPIDYQVELWVMHFEADENGQAQLSAVWTIRDGHDGHVLASSQTSASAPIQSDDTAGSAALSQDLGQMSSQIADRIAQLNAGSRPRAARANSDDAAIATGPNS